MVFDNPRTMAGQLGAIFGLNKADKTKFLALNGDISNKYGRMKS